MTNREIFNKHFEALKTCPPAEVALHNMAITEVSLFLDKNELRQFSDTLYKWAEGHAAKKPLLFCYAKLYVGFSYFFTEQFEKAFPILNEAYNLFVAQNDLDGAAVCQDEIGNIYRTFGNTDLALQSLWAAHEQLKGKRVHQNAYFAANINLAGIYIDQKHYEEALPLLNNTLEEAEKNEKYLWVVYALHGLGKIYLIQKKYPDAKDALEKAMAIAEKFNHPITFCNSISELGNYYFAFGDYSCAAEFHNRALALREKYGFTGGAITSYIRLGEVYIAQFKPSEAITTLEKGLKLAEQAKLKPKMFQIHLLLSEIYQRKNEMEKSLFHYKQYHELYAQVELEDDEKKIRNAKLVFEAEQTRKENVIIKRQKEEIEKKNVELQDTIDELTLARVSRKARAFTLVIGIALFIIEDTMLHFTLHFLSAENFFISMTIKIIIIFSLKPIDAAIEHYLLRKVIRKRREGLVPSAHV